MRISFLHLSDLHLDSSKAIHPAKIQAVVNSLGIYAPFEGIVIILSGDIAASGQTTQYKIAATFLERLIPQLKTKYSLSQKNIKTLIVPGNHDVDWGGKARLESSKIRSFVEEEKKFISPTGTKMHEELFLFF